MGIQAMVDTMSVVRVAFPDWTARTLAVAEEEDGSYTVATQQLCGAMQATMPAMGPFPEVPLASAPAVAKEGTAEGPAPLALGQADLDDFGTLFSDE